MEGWIGRDANLTEIGRRDHGAGLNRSGDHKNGSPVPDICCVERDRDGTEHSSAMMALRSRGHVKLRAWTVVVNPGDRPETTQTAAALGSARNWRSSPV